MINNSESSYDSFFKLLFEASPHPYLILQPDSAFRGFKFEVQRLT